MHATMFQRNTDVPRSHMAPTCRRSAVSERKHSQAKQHLNHFAENFLHGLGVPFETRNVTIQALQVASKSLYCSLPSNLTLTDGPHFSKLPQCTDPYTDSDDVKQGKDRSALWVI
jgi:hypothetical protein